MRKILFTVLMCCAAAFVGCSKDDSDKEQQTNDFPCKFNVVYEKAGKPEIRTVQSGRYGKPERVIDFEIADYQEMIINAPSPQNISVYYNQKIRESDFRQYQSHFTSLGNLSATSEKMFIGIMQNDDYFMFDKNDTKATQSVKVSFHCIHAK